MSITPSPRWILSVRTVELTMVCAKLDAAMVLEATSTASIFENCDLVTIFLCFYTIAYVAGFVKFFSQIPTESNFLQGCCHSAVICLAFVLHTIRPRNVPSVQNASVMLKCPSHPMLPCRTCEVVHGAGSSPRHVCLCQHMAACPPGTC